MARNGGPSRVARPPVWGAEVASELVPDTPRGPQLTRGRIPFAGELREQLDTRIPTFTVAAGTSLILPRRLTTRRAWPFAGGAIAFGTGNVAGLTWVLILSAVAPFPVQLAAVDTVGPTPTGSASAPPILVGALAELRVSVQNTSLAAITVKGARIALWGFDQMFGSGAFERQGTGYVMQEGVENDVT